VHEHVAYHSLHLIYCIYVSVSYLHIFYRSHGARTRETTEASTSQGRWLRARPRQLPVHLTTILELFYFFYILFMILVCVLGYRSWIGTLVALRHFLIYPCDPITRDRLLAMARRRCRIRYMVEWSKDHVVAIGSLKLNILSLITETWLKWRPGGALRGKWR
jgi:hypothetical protein